jgi:phage FluMu gp28-like protein
MRNVPFQAQRDIGHFVVARLPRFGHGANDATGNGAYLAEVMAQKFGARISEIKLSAEWYRENSPAYVEAFGDGTVTIAGDDDVMRDHQALQFVNGVIRVPEDMRYAGSDGFLRHGDTAISGVLAWYASRQGAVDYGYQPVRPRNADGAREGDGGTLPPEEDDETERDDWAGPLGARLRGSI